MMEDETIFIFVLFCDKAAGDRVGWNGMGGPGRVRSEWNGRGAGTGSAVHIIHTYLFIYLHVLVKSTDTLFYIYISFPCFINPHMHSHTHSHTPLHGSYRSLQQGGKRCKKRALCIAGLVDAR